MDRFTLNDLAIAMRGIPRDAVILIRLPDGRLVNLERVEGANVTVRDGEVTRVNVGAAYAIVLVPKG